MKKYGWIALVAAAIAGCQSIAYKPYLPEQFRGYIEDPEPTQPGLFTGKRGEYVIMGR